MASMEQQRRPRRSFSEQYKAEVVTLCRSSEKSMAEIARDLDLTESSVRRWVSQAEIDAIAARLNTRPRKTLEYQTPAHRLVSIVASIP